MEWVTITLRMYVYVAQRAASVAMANWPVLLSVFAYVVLMTVAAQFAFFLGILGGFLVGFVWAGCIGSFLYLVEMLVRQGKVVFDDFPRSFTAYLWDVMGVLFTLWILRMVLYPALASTPQGPVLLLAVNLILFVLLNAVPELIYLGHHSLVELLAESYRFIGENWIEWFPPNMLAGAVLIWILDLPFAGVAAWLQLAVAALFLYFVMVLRGFLFLELSQGSRRSRMFRYRAGS